VVLVVANSGQAFAQDAKPEATAGYKPPIFGTLSPESVRLAETGAPLFQDKDQPCPGCPKRRPWVAIGEVLGINLLYNVMNLVIKPEEEKIYFKTYPKIWWNNISYGFEWDDNTFQVSQLGHPYQGYDYHDNAAYQFGGQSIATAFTGVRSLSPAWKLVTTLHGGCWCSGPCLWRGVRRGQG
jgi:hypothetical protein